MEDGNLGVRVVVKNATSMQEFRNYISQNPISVEYELQTSEQYPEKLIAKTPINTLDKNMSDIVRDEVEKTLNLFNGVWEQGTFDPDGGEIYIVSRVRSTKMRLDAGTYSISLSGADDIEVYIFNDDGTLKDTTDWLEGNTFTLSESGIISIACRKSDNSDISPEDIQNTMLVKGSHAYPYQPYNGAIVHEKQLDDALEGYLPLSGGTMSGEILMDSHPLNLGGDSRFTKQTEGNYANLENANFNVVDGIIQEGGQRVYSPNNPPPGISPQIYSIPITFVNINASLLFGYTGRTYAHSIACRMPDGFAIPTDFIIGLETGARNVSVPVCNFYTDNGAIFCGLVTYVTDARSVPSVPISANKEYKLICVKDPVT